MTAPYSRAARGRNRTPGSDTAPARQLAETR